MAADAAAAGPGNADPRHDSAVVFMWLRRTLVNSACWLYSAKPQRQGALA